MMVTPVLQYLARQRALFVAALLGVVVAAVVLAGVSAAGVMPRESSAANAKPPPWSFPLSGNRAPTFSLLDQFGHPRTLASFAGREVVLAFIDSKCTSVCPLTAEILKSAQERLGSSTKSRVSLVAINANPLVTSTTATWQWSKQHHMLHAWSFLTGTPSQLRRVYRAYRVYDQVTPDKQVQHDSTVIIIDAHGRQRLYFDTASMTDKPTVSSQEKAYAAGMRQWVPAVS